MWRDMLRIYFVMLSVNTPLNIHLRVNNNFLRKPLVAALSTYKDWTIKITSLEEYSRYRTQKHCITVLSHAESSAIEYNPVECSHVGYRQIFYASYTVSLVIGQCFSSINLVEKSSYRLDKLKSQVNYTTCWRWIRKQQRVLKKINSTALLSILENLSITWLPFSRICRPPIE